MCLPSNLAFEPASFMEENPQKVYPWADWPREIPCEDCKEYDLLNNDEFLREMIVECRARVFSELKRCLDTKDAAVLLQGGRTSDFEFYDSDTLTCVFRQEPYFRYIFGVNEPDCMGILDLEHEQTILLVPKLDEDTQRWNGEIRPFEFYKETYAADECTYTSEVHKILQKCGAKNLYLLDGVNTDSGLRFKTKATFDEMEHYKTDSEKLLPVLAECRVFKTPKEIQFLRQGMLVSSQAHVYVMRQIKPGMTERQLEALFLSWCAYFGGARHCAYTCICASGAHGAILHYGHAGRANNRILKPDDTVLLDMGGEYRGYATDITTSYTVNGKFTEQQRIVYKAVYDAQKAVLDAMKPGVHWPDMHRLAERRILEHMLAANVLCNGTVEDFMNVHLGTLFMPHGLGHLMGLNVHDVGGFTEEFQPSKEPGICYLRYTRVLKAGMVTSVEPGCYFIDYLIEKALKNPCQEQYLNKDELAKYRGFGGVRLEDDVLVTEDGIEQWTIVPRTIEEIQNAMFG